MYVRLLTLNMLLAFPGAANANYFFSPSVDEVEEVAEKSRQLYDPDHIEYGVDVSFPMHLPTVSDNYAWLEHNTDLSKPIPKEYQDKPIQPLGNRQQFYEDFMQGCRDHYGKSGKACDATESSRVAMSLRQPQSMVNYTDTGFKKVRAPPELMTLLIDFWEKNKNSEQKENWFTGNTYTNSWSAPTSMVSVENKNLRGGGHVLKQKLWDAAKSTLQEWTGEELTPCSLYGIRIYKEGAVLATHVDRLPLVSSAIINVAQDVDEDWPIEVIGHDGKAHNVSMAPGDMVLYESHSVLHGRPFPLKGRYYANIFIHFEPTGHTLRHHGDIHDHDYDVDSTYKKAQFEPTGHTLRHHGDIHDHDYNVDSTYRKAQASGQGGHENDNKGLPPYLIAGSPEEMNWRYSHPNYERPKRPKEERKSALQRKMDTFATGSTLAHEAAQIGDAKMLEKIITADKSQVSQQDENGWQPIHEGARGGHEEVVKLLLKHGADMNARTNEGVGGTPLWLAEQEHGSDHAVVQFLRAIGAESIGPEL
eukprot:CAMPEP_0196826108 /NCGR_PEP_ID=MMETSP1362-20130617/93443_1 /TAXON_ID=163516 /ORGANISM="Leptocylindrus danicus, Strain CCMP1856" /LENGTH=531 /DNA_ID=CAMNT_0042206649 /DNA_START=118 /DNA_END=1714 /DNA_ORIENTATION=+